MSRAICISGMAYGKNYVTGLERYTIENIKRIDKKIPAGMDVYLLCDTETDDRKLPELENIEIVKKPLWTERKGFVQRVKSTENFLRDINGRYIDLCGYYGMQKGCAVCIHDIRGITYDKAKTLKAFLKKQMSKYSYGYLADKVATVSETSKKEIADYFRKPESDIYVTYNGWEHLLEIQEDEQFWTGQEQMKKGMYFYALGSVMQHKNYAWIIACAKNNPSHQFVVAGNSVLNCFGDAPENVIYLGYVDDRVNKTLMRNCRAFIQPSKYEGFGIPPLEAMACGANLILSEIPVFRELYDGCASFFDPDDYHFDCDSINFLDHTNYESCLKKYSWNYSSDRWVEIMKQMI